MPDSPTWKSALEATLADFSCQTATFHRSLDGGKTLSLVAQIGVPDALLDKIATIPFGKGIAGAAAARAEPVEICNLQQDLGGVARPAARQTGVAGSLAVPVFSPADGSVIGTLGIGKSTPHRFSEAEKQRLAEAAAGFAVRFTHKENRGD